MRGAESRDVLIQDKRGALLLGLAAMVYVTITGMCISLVPIVAPALQDRFAFSASQIGLLTSMFMLTTSLGSIPMGLAASRFGGRLLVAAGGVFVVGLALFAVASSYPLFIVARLLQGVGASAGPPVATWMMTRYVAPRYHGWTLGVFGCGQGVGVLLTLLIMPTIQDAAGYRGVFLATAGITAVLVLLTLRRKEVRSAAPAAPRAASLTGVLRTVGSLALDRRLLLVILVNIGAMALFIGTLTWTPSFLSDQRGTTLAIAAYLTAGLGLAQLLGAPVGATAMARWGKARILVAGMVVDMVACALIPFAPGVAGVFVCVVITGFVTMTLFPSLLGSIPEIVPGERAGAATGYMYTVNLVATMLAPWLFGVLLDRYGAAKGDPGYMLGYQLCALFALVGVVCALVLFFTRKPVIAPEAEPAIQPEVADL